ncbi:MAG TPA: tetratricopeptide repeat protein [Hyphomicrobiales bacterium]|nr:tetratricopeptide repeat protein [Hyphomicrobiales bacterium]
MKPFLRPTLFLACAAFALAAEPAAAQAQCPDLAPFYPQSDADWPATRQALADLMEQCLLSSEYYALLGAAQLNTGQLPEALEALERALLLDPDNGAAQIDYAQALYLSGQLFAALELSETLLARTDLPVAIRPLLQERRQAWDGERRGGSLIGEVSAGFDTNLNGAPANSELMLTISGESIIATLDPEYQPKEGGFGNLRLLGNYAVLEVDRRHDFLMSLRNRSSTDADSDIVQLDWRYGYTREFQRLVWETATGTSHLLYGGSPLYSVAEVRSRLKLGQQRCTPLTELAGQFQRYHGQSLFSGIELSLGGGVECTSPDGRAQWQLEAGYLLNAAENANRPGGDREGWRVQLGWQYRLPMGWLDMNASYARLDDEQGYSDLIEYGASRSVESVQARLRYQYQLSARTQLFSGLSYQDQNSNLNPFKNSGTAVDLGLQYRF